MRPYGGPVTSSGEEPAEVYRITGAVQSRSADLDRRINRYLASMAVRTACVVLIFVVHGPARWVFAVGAVFLPYVAVLLANTGDRRHGTAPAPVEHRALGTAAGGAPAAPAVPEVLIGTVIDHGPQGEGR